ncbi:MAG: hypothetical protein HKO65_06800 [Gemmatimonadetes bacterium]|nr:hypothetical protein [Gemmatimonadota bacterium]
MTLAHLGLDEKDEAIKTALQLVEEVGGGDCRRGFRTSQRTCTLLARVYAHFGEHDAAIDLLDVLLPAPSWLTVHLLEIDPIWAPLHGHPRFQKLLEKYANDVEH